MATTMTDDETAWTRTIAKRVKIIRVEHDWSQQDLADRASLTRNKISAIERSADYLRVYEINRIAHAAGVDLSDLLDGASRSHVPRASSAARGPARRWVAADGPGRGTRRAVLGICGFGGSAHLAAQTALAEGMRVHVRRRGSGNQQAARRLGVDSVGASGDAITEPLDGAVTFAPPTSLTHRPPGPVPRRLAAHRGST